MESLKTLEKAKETLLKRLENIKEPESYEVANIIWKLRYLIDRIYIEQLKQITG